MTEKEYLKIVNTVDKVIFFRDAQSHEMLFVNKAYEKVWGRSCESLYQNSSSFIDTIYKDDKEKVLKAYNNFLEKGTYQQDYRIIMPDESIKWIRAKTFPIYEDNGSVDKIVGIAEEVTNEKNIEKLLNEIQQLAGIGGWKLNLKTGDVYISDTILELHELPYDYEVCFENIFKLYPTRSRKKIENAYKTLKKTGRSFELKLEYITGNDKVKWIKIIGKAIYQNNEIEQLYGSFQDITRQHESEITIKSLAKFPKENPEPVFRVDYSGKILFSNNKSKKVENYLTQRLPEFVTKDFVDTLKNGENVNKQCKIEPGLFYSITFSPVLTQEYFNIYCRNISEQKKSEEEIIHSQKRFRDVVESSEGYIWEVDDQGNYKFLTPKIKEVLHYSIDELLGHSPFEFMPEEDSQETQKKFWEYIKQGSRFNNLEHRSIRKDKKIIWQSVNGIPMFDKSGKLTGYRGIGVDITEKKEAEQRLNESEKLYRLISENSRDMICLHDPQGRYLYVSKAAKDLLGFTPEEMVGKNPYDFFHPDDAERIKNESHNRAVKGQLENTIQYRMQTKSGNYTWFETSTKPIFDKKGNITNLQTSSRDITYRKKIEMILRKEKERAEMATQAKAQFLSTMSHEIRTPLNAVIGVTHLLHQNNKSPEFTKMLDTLKFSSENLLVLVNDILDFNKIESGQIIFEESEFKLSDLIKSIESSLKYKATEKNLNVYIEYDSSIPQVLIGDPVRISQILNNLTSNAVKFTHEGKITITVKKTKESNDKVQLYFEVTDTGIGIAKDKQQVVFDRFTQASDDTTRKFGGTGLGLAITKQLLSLMGSGINLESEPGKGTRLYFKLKLQKSKKTELPENKALTTDLSEVDMSGIKILVVEDNEVNQFVVSQFLESWNADVDYAINGKEALRKVAGDEYDLVLMDMQMPVMDGYTATRKIRELPDEHYKKLPIIALTASAMLEIRRKIMQSGVNDYISKPFNPKELFYKIAKHSGLSTNVDYIKKESKSPSKSSESVKKTIHKAIINYDNVLQITGSNEEFLKRFITVTGKSFKQFVKDYKIILAEKDYEKYRKLIHRMKPAVETLDYKEFEEELENARTFFNLSNPDKELEQKSIKKFEKLTRQLIEYLDSKI